MRVLRLGRKVEDHIIQGTCRSCDALFEFSVGEATHVSDQKDGDYLRINCPCCGGTYTKTMKVALFDFRHAPTPKELTQC